MCLRTGAHRTNTLNSITQQSLNFYNTNKIILRQGFPVSAGAKQGRAPQHHRQKPCYHPNGGHYCPYEFLRTHLGTELEFIELFT